MMLGMLELERPRQLVADFSLLFLLFGQNSPNRRASRGIVASALQMCRKPSRAATI